MSATRHTVGAMLVVGFLTAGATIGRTDDGFVLGGWALVLWLCAVTSAGITWFLPPLQQWHSSRHSRRGAGLGLFYPSEEPTVENRHAVTATTPGPDVMLLAPSAQWAYRWVPAESLSISQAEYPSNRGVMPTFGLKNFSDQVLTGISIDWAIAASDRVEEVFLSSQVFSRFQPAVTSEGKFRLTRDAKANLPRPLDAHTIVGSVEMPVTDAATSHIEYCQHEVDAPMPVPVAGSYGLRLVASTDRPLRNRAIAGPDLKATVRFRSADRDHINRFRITSEVLTFADKTSAGTMKNVERADWSDLNFRGRARFTVHRDD